jgi:hypothetical protein
MSQTRMTYLRTRIGFWLLLLVWCCCVAIGLGAMTAYETTPAPTLSPERRWPDASGLVRDPERPTLVMFVHPRCPCSRASLSELAILASQCPGRVSLRTIFVQPVGGGEGWEETALWAAAKQIPGVTASTDRGGIQADRFRARTSGETFLYAADGRLLFHGGITSARGHEGANAGRAALIALIHRGVAEQDQSPVFGCSLSNPCCPPIPASDDASHSHAQ